jgi:PAS domain S-box-containing protein/putative nucleotidyltransferase with HDIG domain
MIVVIHNDHGRPVGYAALRDPLASGFTAGFAELPHTDRRTMGSIELRDGDTWRPLLTWSSESGSDAPEADAMRVVAPRADPRATIWPSVQDDEVEVVETAAGMEGFRVLVASPRSEALGTILPQVEYGFGAGGITLLVGALGLSAWRSRSAALASAAGKAEAERALAERAKQEWERLVLDLPELGVCLADASTGRIVYANAKLAEMLGRARESLIGETWRPVTRPEQLERIGAAISKLALGEADAVELELSGPLDDGTERHTHTVLRALRDATGEVVHLAAIVRDVTDEKLRRDEREEMLRRQHAALLAAIDAIARMIELRDPYTAGHQRRVSQLAAAIGEELGLDELRVEGLRVAGKVHDLGKIVCPAEILVKPGPLTKPERAIAQQHAEEGARILQGLELPWPLAEVIHQHHEHIDGSGYPRALRGDDILLEARIIRVASTLVALTSHRPYRPAKPLPDALQELEGHKGTRYDEAVVDACLRLFAEQRFSWAGSPRA